MDNVLDYMKKNKIKKILLKKSFMNKFNKYKNKNSNETENFKENFIIKQLKTIYEKTNINNNNINKIIVTNFFINSIVTNKNFQFFDENMPNNLIIFLINI